MALRLLKSCGGECVVKNIFQTIFSDQFIPHGFCFMWRPELVWMHVLSDLAIAIAYFSIPFTIMFLVHRQKQSMPYIWVFRMFAAFIFLCGMTHIMSVISIWYPVYYLEGIIKVFTAAVSLATAIMIFPLVPVLIERFAQNGVDEDFSADRQEHRKKEKTAGRVPDDQRQKEE